MHAFWTPQEKSLPMMQIFGSRTGESIVLHQIFTIVVIMQLGKCTSDYFEVGGKHSYAIEHTSDGMLLMRCMCTTPQD